MVTDRVEVRTRPRPPLPASQQRAVDEFWRRRQEEIEATVDFKERVLPMARLKKVIIRATEEGDGMMISADTPAFLSRLCELFVQELAVRAWACAESHNRRIILDSDVAEAVASTESYDFLLPLLLEHMHEVAQAARATPAAPPATARLVTRKRHRPDPGPGRAARRKHPRVLPPMTPPAPPAPPSSVGYMPFPSPCVLGEAAAPPSEDGRMLPVPPINYATRGCVLFRNSNGNTFAGENSAAAGQLLPNVPPAAYCCCPCPVMDDGVEAFAVGNTDANFIPPEFVDGSIASSDANGDGGQQLKQGGNVDHGHGEGVVGQQSRDVQDAASGVLGGAGNDSPMYMLVEEILVDEDLLFPDAGLSPLVSAPPDLEDFFVDQDVLDDVFANPSSSSSTGSN